MRDFGEVLLNIFRSSSQMHFFLLHRISSSLLHHFTRALSTASYTSMRDFGEVLLNIFRSPSQRRLRLPKELVWQLEVTPDVLHIHYIALSA